MEPWAGDTALECWDLGQGQKLGDSDKVAPLSKHLQSLTSWAIFFGKVSHDQVEVGQFLALPLETPMEELRQPLPSSLWPWQSVFTGD